MLKNLIFFRFFFVFRLFATNKLRLSLYTHTASGNPSFAWLSLFVLNNFSYPQKKTLIKNIVFLISAFLNISN